MNKSIAKFALIHVIKFYGKNLFNNSLQCFSPLYFALLCLTLFHIAIGPQVIESDISWGIILTITVLSLVYCLDQIYQENILEHLYLSGLSSFALISCNLILSLLYSMLVCILIIGFGAVLYDITLYLRLFWLMCLFLPAFVALFNFTVLLSHYNKALQFVISFPLTVPLMIFTILCLKGTQPATLLIGVNLIYLPLFVFCSIKLLDIKMEVNT